MMYLSVFHYKKKSNQLYIYVKQILYREESRSGYR